MIETNFEKIGKQLDTIGQRLYKKALKQPSEVRKAFAVFGRKTRDSMVYSMLYTPKTGRIYKYKKRKYRASAPGESPAVRSSKLIKALAYTVKKDQVEVGVLRRVLYAKYLEPDTEKGIRNRPFLMVNVNKHWPDTEAYITRILFDVHRELMITKIFQFGGQTRSVETPGINVHQRITGRLGKIGIK